MPSPVRSSSPQLVASPFEYICSTAKSVVDALTILDAPPLAVPLKSAGRSGHSVLVWCPHLDPVSLHALASVEPDVHNWTSADLLTCKSMLSWATADGWSVELDTWALPPGFMSSSEWPVPWTQVFASPVACAENKWTYSEERWDALLGAVQGAAAGSGPNYRPERIYTEAKLASHAGQQDEVDALRCRPLVVTYERVMQRAVECLMAFARGSTAHHETELLMLI